MDKICKISGKQFEITEEDINFYNKLGISIPTLCPEERNRRRMMWRNDRSFYNRKCSFTNNSMISIYPADVQFPVYHPDIWYGDKWNPMDYGQDFDFNRSFFDQWHELMLKVPRLGIDIVNCENSYYCNYCGDDKNCYLDIAGEGNEDCYYNLFTKHSKNVVDCTFAYNSELLYECINCHKCYNVTNSIYLEDCSDCSFCFDLKGCKNCLFCTNLRQKEYCIANKQYTKEEYEEKMKEWDLSSRNIYEHAKKMFIEYIEKYAFHRALTIDNCENSYGNYLLDDKNCYNCFFIDKSEDCINDLRCHDIKDVIDSVSIFKAELVVHSVNVQGESYDARYCSNLMACKFMEYSTHCVQCENCFLSCGLYQKKYHILNKEYSPEEYKKEVNRIKEIMKNKGIYGEFFPGYFAANPYEESLSSFYFPLSKEEQKKLGFRVKMEEERKNPGYVSQEDIPDNSKDVYESITTKVFWDEKSKKPFQIREFDVDFAKKLGIPLSHTYYMARLQENFSWLSFDGELRDIVCPITGENIKTSLSSKYDGRILSEKSYLEKVV
jgi:hypothetical protein